MKKFKHEVYNINISYINKIETCNKLSEFIISFITENKDILEVKNYYE